MDDATTPKIKILQDSASPDMSCATFQIHDETHTIGNSLRWMIMKNPKVEFCGYSVPHPSENHINLRIQMYDGLSAVQALIIALNDLDTLCQSVQQKYDTSLGSGDFKRWDEKN